MSNKLSAEPSGAYNMRAAPSARRVPVISMVGLLIWVAALALLTAPLAARILLLAPLVILPRLLALIPHRPEVARPGVLNATAVLLGVAAYRSDGS